MKEQKKWLNSSLLCVIYLLLVTVILISLCGSILSILFIAMDLFGVPGNYAISLFTCVCVCVANFFKIFIFLIIRLYVHTKNIYA